SGRSAAPAGPPAPAAPRISGPPLHLRRPGQLVERELLKVALQYPQLVSPVFDAFGADEFTAEPYALVRTTVEAAGGTEAAGSDFLSRVLDAAPDDTVRKLITELAVEALRCPGGGEPDEAYAGQQLVAVRLAAVRARSAEIEGTARRLDAQGANERSAPLWQELWVLQRYATALRERGAAAL
ncbi:DNA primase, partial [Streptomyces durbertensis]|nr:DNA primase [Streptomyces durbertensis]